MITTEGMGAWCLVNGTWVEREDPVMAICDPCGGDVGAAMASLGYEAWCEVGVGELPPVPVSLALYSREAPPLQFLLQLEGNAGDVVEHVFAETLPDALDLLARWAPLARHGAGTGRPGDRTGRHGDDPAGAGDVPGRLADDQGRPRGLDGDRPGPARPISSAPATAGRTVPPRG